MFPCLIIPFLFASQRFPAFLYYSFCFLKVSLPLYTIPFCFSTFPCLFILFLWLFKVSLPLYTIPFAAQPLPAFYTITVDSQCFLAFLCRFFGTATKPSITQCVYCRDQANNTQQCITARCIKQES